MCFTLANICEYESTKCFTLNNTFLQIEFPCLKKTLWIWKIKFLCQYYSRLKENCTNVKYRKNIEKKEKNKGVKTPEAAAALHSQGLASPTVRWEWFCCFQFIWVQNFWTHTCFFRLAPGTKPNLFLSFDKSDQFYIQISFLVLTQPAWGREIWREAETGDENNENNGDDLCANFDDLLWWSIIWSVTFITEYGQWW